MSEASEWMNMAEECAPATEMPRYQSHKQVWALKIAGLGEVMGDGSRTMVPADEGYAPFVLDGAYCIKHNPQVGGYYVVYADGYKSFSPAAAFEAGNTRIAA
jgi:hypothetical protein